MKLCQIADLCVRETKAGSVGGGANDATARTLVIIGIQAMPDNVKLLDKKELRRAMAAKYKAEHKTGFLFSMIVLPVMISLISHWLIKWFTDHPLRLREAKAGEVTSCSCQRPTGDMPICTSTEKAMNLTLSKSLPSTLPGDN
jgi:hypothetical protein